MCGAAGEYGFGVDMWAFGCIYFEMVEKEGFLVYQSFYWCRLGLEVRLGPMPDGAGLWQPGPRDHVGQVELPELVSYRVAQHPWIACTLR